MITRDEVKAIGITMSVFNVHQMYILLANDGTVQRCGDGNLKKKGHDIFMGRTDEPYFDELLEAVPDSMFEHLDKEFSLYKKGIKTELEIHLFGEGKSSGIKFVFSQQEPYVLPNELFTVIEKAKQLTEPWFTQQLEFKKLRDQSNPENKENTNQSIINRFIGFFRK